MTFISWLVFGLIFMFSEFATGTFYLLAIGLAFVYPAIAAYTGASTGMQMAALAAGALVHSLLVMLSRKRNPSGPSNIPEDIGQRVEIIEWLDESSARVKYRGQMWEADKARSEMPDASHGIIKSVQGSRLIISTE
jgi:membrane protein implicated in regulation of membrane protease activity